MDVRESFRSAFVDTAERRRRRIDGFLAETAGPDLPSVAAELHCLSGEASMLDFGRVADIARVAERAARAGEEPTLRRLLGDLDTAIGSVRPAGEGQ